MKKLIYSLLVIFSLTLCVFFVTESYAKYITSAQGNANMKVARWKIIVNNEDIRDNKTLEAEIKPTFLETEHIASDVIAPTSEGYFDLIIDATAADVSFKYNINFSVNENSAVSDLVVSKYSINDGAEINLPADNQSIENTVLYSNNTSPISIRVYVLWNDGEGSTMDNEADTNATKDGKKAMMDVNLSFTQLK